jgi:hypothetical protein
VRPRAIQGPPAPGDQQGDHGLGREHAYKPPDADRLAKIGLFVGGSPATPGLTEAKRTAAASEQTNKLLTVIEGKLVKGGWQSATAYTD